MRKEVRIGLGIGGVLLAVLIVYLLVPKDNTSRDNRNQQAAQTGTSTGGADGTGTADAAAGGTQPPESAIAGSTAGTSGAGNGTGAGPSTSAAEDIQQADANRGVDWSTLLEKGVMPESLMATRKDPFADETRPAATGNGAAPLIDWNTPAGAAPGASADNATPNSGAGTSGTTPGAIAGGTRAAGGATAAGPAAGGTTPVSGVTRTQHTIKPGETFSTIALSTYGDARHYIAIQAANPDVDERRLRPGTVIKLPDAAAVRAPRQAGGEAVTAGAAARAALPAIDPGKEYRVQPNDSLEKIALKLYGKSAKWQSIYELNRDRIGGDSSRIKVGMVLKLPEAPTNSPTATR